ncbi:hypothetical protein F4777DRAFT_587377 [Nemania sp. FL0916]|nr:hypothetical protein F4777DRAFT_587377 [Nemania sp. FL0916]
MLEISEAARARETLKYEASAIAATRLFDHSQVLSSPVNANFTADPVLTSLAQLVAVRFDAVGAIISFFDAKIQYILAQATQLSPIIHVQHDDEREQCCLLGKAILRRKDFCEDVLLEVGTDEASLPNKGEGGRLLPVSVVLDTASSPSSTPAGILGIPDVRFCAAVPIRSVRGFNIGVLTVYGTQPRTEIEPRLVTFLRDMSITVTNHLEMKRARTDLRRSARMVRGLGSFVEGAGGMSFNPATSNAESFRNEGIEGTLNSTQQDIQHEEGERETRPPLMKNPRPYPSRDQSPFASVSSLPTDIPTRTRNHVLLEPREHQLQPPPPPVSSTMSIRSIGNLGSNDDEEDEHTSSIKHVFSRAANIIRESIEVEGVIFADASLSSFGGLVGMNSGSDASVSTHSSSEESLIDDQHDHSDGAATILGYSTTTSSSLDKSRKFPGQAVVPEKFLKTLLWRYPEGKVYHFAEDGSLSSTGDSSGNEGAIPPISPSAKAPGEASITDKPIGRRRTAKWSRQNEGISLLKIIPNAKAVIVVPLWDYSKERWYAGAIVWTCTPARLFTKEADLSYLRAFGTTVLAELARIEAQMYDKAKTDVLGSLSHELRSPLHGVVAATDLLHDTSLDAFQCDVLHSLESCGRVLLDVLDHLLDFSKVNRLVQGERVSRKSRKSIARSSRSQRSLPHNRTGLLMHTHLDSLLEESIDSVFAGYIFQKFSIAQLDHRPMRNADATALQRTDIVDAVESFGHQTASSGRFDIQLGDVHVLVDIDPSVSWGFHAQPGALRRVILNIFGNSLRYTDRGFIIILLRQEKNPSKRSSHRTNIKLTVSDTGRGMSAYFMQHHLFKPFAQEDPLSPGTGLGLSLVKQIIKTLDGNVTVESQVGIGTCVQVTVPVPEATDDTQANLSFEEHRTALSGLRVSLVGLNTASRRMIRDELSASESQLMHKVCSEWLKLQVIEIDGDVRPDLVLCGEVGMNNLLRDTGKDRLLAPIVTICKDAVTAHQHIKFFSGMRGHRILEFISRPIGPRKLAKSLDAALRRWTEAAQAEIPDSGSEPMTPRLQPSMIPFSIGPKPDEPIVPNNKDSEGKVALGEPTTNPELPTGADEFGSSQDNQQESSQSRSVSVGPKEVLSDAEQATLSSITTQSQEILLVDDNNVNLRILVAYMKKLKKPYKTATNGLEALEMFAISPSNFSCILMDLSMPVMDGLESTRKIRELERSQKLQPAITIIALSGLASRSSQQEAFASGMDLYLTKPLRLKDLNSVLTERNLM